MIKLKLERIPAPFWFRPLIPLLAIVVTFLVTSILVILAEANPFEAAYYFVIAPLSNRVSLLEVLVKGTPLILTGVAVTIAFASGYWNIGAEGQLYAGAIAAAWLGPLLGDFPPAAAILIMLVAGFLAGMAWALIPALLKVKLAVDEVVTTLLMNSIILFVVSFLLNGPWRDPVSGWPQSPQIAASAMLPKLIARSRLHFGFLVALGMTALVWFILTRTSLGLRMRATGRGQEAARFLGLNVSRIMLTAALLSGGIAGLAGVSEVGGIHFHLIDALSPGYGYSGIIVATLSGLHPIGASAAALFIGLIDTGAQSVSRALGVPVFLGNIVQSTLLLVTLGMFLLQNYRLRKVK